MGNQRNEKEKTGSQVCLGVVTGAKGVQGEVRLKSFTQKPEDIAAYGDLTSEDGSRVFKFKRIEPIKGGFVARIEGVEDRDKALALKGEKLYLAREALPETEEEEFYYADLMGLEVRFANDPDSGKPDKKAGFVSSVFDFGAGDLLEVQLTETGKRVLVPFTREVVPEISFDGGFLTIDPPEGLLTEPAKEERQEQG